MQKSFEKFFCFKISQTKKSLFQEIYFLHRVFKTNT